MLIAYSNKEIIALSPAHSHVFDVLRVTLKTWEWPGDEARKYYIIHGSSLHKQKTIVQMGLRENVHIVIFCMSLFIVGAHTGSNVI